MARTLGSVRTALRDHIDEPNANYWSDAELNRYIGRSQLDLWNKIDQLDTDFFLKSGGTQINLAAGTYTYALPADCARVEAIRTLTAGSQGQSWRAVNANSAEFQYLIRTDLTITDATEMLFAVRGDGNGGLVLWVAPTPQVTSQIQVDYSTRPVEVAADTDGFQMPDSFVHWIEYTATVLALAKAPAGQMQKWQDLADRAWKDIMLEVDTPKQDQGPDLVVGAFEGY